ncbi:EpsG family protein [Mesonia phycicola]|uniref:EpsG family protein n=1 Tax=Mesonia phycicola TaxID=579105 RepID=A0A1M6H2M2_9FLAO|nr:EpsG family protein [Mesonia phycicola]SHJ16425.1 EpsG family protein [Mesonia phycicola]
MLVYLILFVGFVFFYFQNNQSPSIGIYLFFGFAILIAGFRDMIGGFDVYIYSDVFEHDLDQFAQLQIFDPGFMAYFALIKQVDDTREWMLLISSIIVLGTHFYSIKKLSPLFYVSLFIYFAKFYLMSFVYIRQGMAMVLVWLAFTFIKKEKKIWIWVLAIAAVFMHKTAIVVLPFLLVRNRAFSLFQVFSISIIAGIVSLSPIGDFLLGSAIENIDDKKLEVYADKSGGVNIFYLIEGFLVIFLVLTYRTKMYVDENKRWILNGLLFYGLIILLSLTNATFIRFAWYYFIFVVIGLPYLILETLSLEKMKLFKTVVFLYYTAIFFRLMLVYDGGDFMPYKSIFQDFNRDGQWEHMEYRYE